MRYSFIAVLGAWIGLMASPAAFGALWIANHGTLTRVDADTRLNDRTRLNDGTRLDNGMRFDDRTRLDTVARFDVPPDARNLAATSDGGTWMTAAGRLWSVTHDGTARVRANLADLGVGNPILAHADPFDGSLWIATDTSLLLHFASDGTLLQGTTLPAPAIALTVDLDQSVWLAADDRLLHFGRDAKWLESRDLGLASDETVTALGVDALRDQLWIGTTHALYRLPADPDSALASTAIVRGETAALALDPRSGNVIALVDGSIVALGSREDWRRIDVERDEGERPIGVLYDADGRLFVIRTTLAIVHVTHAGEVVARHAATAESVVATTPFRIEPSLALVRPPDGGAVTDAKAEIMLRITAQCNGVPCEAPERYLRSMVVQAAFNGNGLGEAVVDQTSGRVVFPERPPMRPGANRLTARVVDRFGHLATLRDAYVTLLAPPTVATGTLTQPPSSEAAAGRALEKAANKPPTVALTSPVNGTTFSAGASITLSASAADPDGTIAKVEFYRGGTTLIGAATTAPYQYVWTSVAAGSYSLTAKAYDNRNGTATSAPVAIVVADNQLPIVSITSPAAGSFFAAGSTVPLAATATDPDGTIARIEFFDGAASLGTVTAAPYALAWTASAGGVHSISARATDNKGGTSAPSSVDIVVGDAPVVVITDPVACSFIDGPSNVMLAADALSASGSIASVAFFDGGLLVGTAFAPPWRVTLANASTGTHSITATATDTRGSTSTSRPSSFTIRAPNQPPSVALASPAEGARFPLGSSVALTASATDADGTVTAVEYRIGSSAGTLIGRATSPPYAVSWANMAVGNYTLVAVAFDDRGATTTSSPVHISVDPNRLPTVTVTAPAANATFFAPATVDIAASASDSDGTIAKVEFFAGTTLVGTATAAPYSATWNNVSVGAYSLTAKATDNLGGVTTSAAVPITVAANAPPTVTLTAPTPGAQYFVPATLSLSASAADSDGTVARVEFYANGTLVGTATSAPYTAAWDNVPAGAYSLTAKAIDNAGSATTSTSVNITVSGGPAINIAAYLDGATIDDDNVLVRGFVSAPANSAVTVNGVVTHIDDYGFFQANDVQLAPGANTVTAIVSTQDGQTSTHSVTINSTGPGAFVVHAAPTEGLDSLTVTFTVENPANRPFKQVFFDLDNDGFPNVIATPDQFFDGKLTVRATYPGGTWLAVIKIYDDQDRVIYSTSKSIVVHQPVFLAGNLRAIYDGMLARLRVGNITGALTAFTGAAYEKYESIFTQLQPDLATIVDQLGEIIEVNFGSDLAEFSVVRNTPEGPKRFMFYLIRAEDGIWRIDGM